MCRVNILGNKRNKMQNLLDDDFAVVDDVKTGFK